MDERSAIKIPYFHRRKTNASGWYKLGCIFRRGKKILHYTLSTRDYKYSESFRSSCIAERSEVTVYVAELLLEIHKMKYSRSKVNPSYAYVTSKCKPRINQMCKKNHYHRTSVIIDGL